MNQIDGIYILWDYITREDYREEFIAMYSPTGPWSKLFSQYKGYLKTTLIQDTSNKNKFITIDYWSSIEAYAEMKSKSRKEYRILDEKFEKYTLSENYIGIFKTL